MAEVAYLQVGVFQPSACSRVNTPAITHSSKMRTLSDQRVSASGSLQAWASTRYWAMNSMSTMPPGTA